MPTLRALDVFSWCAGLALIACAEKVEGATTANGASACPVLTPEPVHG